MKAPTALTFLGGVAGVTGSRTLVEHAGARVLVDCGLFQGLRADRRANWEPFPVDPARIDAVVLSHAHLDHCGYLPALVRGGFSGPVLCTAGTAALTAVVLRDSAHLAEEDARAAREGGWSRHDPPLPLYTAADAERAIAALRPVDDGAVTAVALGLTVQLPSAGHILGSASPLLEADGTRLAFSGDLGRPDHPVLRPPAAAPGADALVVESTYGDRRHPARDLELVAAVLRRTFARGGVVVVPAFAVDRTEVVLLALAELMGSGSVPQVPVFVDSPMALAALRIYREALSAHAAELRPEMVQAMRAGQDPFDPGDLREVPGPELSRRLNDPGFPCILVSASGMASGGRVVHHLASLLPDARNTLLLVGYQALGTRGRALAEGATQVKIHGRYVPVRADVAAVEAFSVHADADELLAWLRSAPRAPAACYVNHGEPAASAALAARISAELGWCAVVPRPGERVLV